jgi:hypothetical protein
MIMEMIYGSRYIVESDIFVLSVSFRTYSLRFSMHAVWDMIAILSLVQLDSFTSMIFLCVDCKQL